MPTVNIIGAGRVGRTFLRLLREDAQDIASATRASAEAAVHETGHGHATELREMRSADLWLLTVPDTQIASAAQSLAQTQTEPSIAIHCSGFHTADIMAPLRDKGWRLASAHPNLSFADAETAAANFPGTPVGIEGDDDAMDATDELLSNLGAETFRIASDQKALYHAAAVFSNNFTTVLQAIAREAWAEAGVPEEIAAKLNASLLNATVRNVTQLGPKASLTGPAARGDRDVVAAQSAKVHAWSTDAGRLYDGMSAAATRLIASGKAV